MFQGTRDAGEPTRFGRIFKPDDAWHAKAPAEPILEPELAIVDTHHHLWDMPRFRYLLDELLADLNTGHNIVATVFEECRSMYRARGPEEMKPVGEVEFVAGVAAMSDSGRYGPAQHLPRHRGLCRPRAWAIAWPPCWRPRSPPAAGASAASATPPAGMPIPSSATATACRARASIATRRSAPA